MALVNFQTSMDNCVYRTIKIWKCIQARNGNQLGVAKIITSKRTSWDYGTNQQIPKLQTGTGISPHVSNPAHFWDRYIQLERIE